MGKGDKRSLAIGFLIAFIGIQYLEDRNLLITSIAFLLSATMTRTFWEIVKRIKNQFRNVN